MAKLSVKPLFALFLLALAALTRLLPHPANFAPMTAMALFSGAMVSPFLMSLLLFLGSLWLSDLLVNNLLFHEFFGRFVFFYDGFYWQYLSYLLISLWGRIAIRKFAFYPIIGSLLSSSVLFFLLSNFGVWLLGKLYPLTLEGLVQCYIAALPFFRNALLGDLTYGALLFGAVGLAYKSSKRESFLAGQG
ncbi:MAG: hypothetical protein NZM25_00520 [Leptospiraceae bacterium]|nr:hypothetical protein [Leptospiraceae bacterium]MDW8306208.1 DUF6580 family putative transport protein [Leptospiraceae bacterium]